MRLLIIAGLIFMAAPFVHAQLVFHVETGYGTYSMRDMKELQADIASGIGITLKTVSEFPGYINFGGGVAMELSETQKFGVNLRYMSTGARSDYSDYSGSARVDNLLHTYNAGVFFEISFYQWKKWDALAFLNGAYTFTNSSIITSISLTDAGSDSETITLKGAGLAASAQLGLQRSFSHGLLLFGRGGYEVNATRDMTYQGNQTDVKAQWSGWRLSLGIGYKFNMFNEPEVK